MTHLTVQDVLARGITYRRLDHWCRKGWLRPAHQGGTGHQREWPQHELQVADLMGRLVDAGIAVDIAALTARAHLDGRQQIRLGYGITLLIDDEPRAGEPCG